MRSKRLGAITVVTLSGQYKMQTVDCRLGIECRLAKKLRADCRLGIK